MISEEDLQKLTDSIIHLSACFNYHPYYVAGELLKSLIQNPTERIEYYNVVKVELVKREREIPWDL